MESQCVTPVPAAPFPAAPVAVGQLPTIQQLPQIRDPEWLKVEVCREFQRGACKRSSEECRYAHPGKNIQVTSDGKVIACFDALKGRCNRESCKYLHPTYQLKQQLEITGRQTLIQNRAMLQQMLPLQPGVVHTSLPQGGVLGYEQVVNSAPQQHHAAMISGLHAVPTGHIYNPTHSAYSMLPAELGGNQHFISPYQLQNYQLQSPLNQINQLNQLNQINQLTLQHQQTTQTAAMLPSAGGLRADRLEVCRDFQRGNCSRGELECRYGHPHDRSLIDATDNTVTVCMDFIKGRCSREKCKYFHPPSHLQVKIRASQNPSLSYLSSIQGTSPQPAAVMMNTGSLGQPPIKRHALESTIISPVTSSGVSPGLTPPPGGQSQSAALAAYYGSYNSNLPGLTQHVQHTTAAYYPQGVPTMLQLYGGAIPSAPSGQLTPLSTPLNQLPTTTAATPNGQAATYALLNGQSQILLK